MGSQQKLASLIHRLHCGEIEKEEDVQEKIEVNERSKKRREDPHLVENTIQSITVEETR